MLEQAMDELGAKWEWGHRALGDKPWSLGETMRVRTPNGKQLIIAVTAITPDAIIGEVVNVDD